MRGRSGALVLLLYAFLLLHRALPAQTSLFAQSAAAALRRSPVVQATPALEFLVLDLRQSEPRSDEPLASTFADLYAPMPIGSLLKPFLILATPPDRTAFIVRCRGAADRCPKRGGHGVLRFPEDLPEALAQSCNAFFLALAARLRPADLDRLEELPPPPKGAPAETLIGLTADWPVAPLPLARAYARLLTAASGPGASPAAAAVLRGMRASAGHGTARAIGTHPGGVLAKTGTAPCHASGGSRSPAVRGAGGAAHCLASGDGLVVAAAPAEHPKLLLLVRQRGTTGAHAAQVAGALLRELEVLHGF